MVPATPPDPGGGDAGGPIDLPFGNMSGGITMDELDLVGEAELFSTEASLLGELPLRFQLGISAYACVGRPPPSIEILDGGIHASLSALPFSGWFTACVSGA